MRLAQMRTDAGAMGCREKTPTALFFKYNSQLGPPYQVLVDTNFINFSIKNKARLSPASALFQRLVLTAWLGESTHAMVY
jgi:hypothetical protein